MKLARVGTVISALAGVVLGCMAAGAQGPGAMAPGFAQHRPPFEQAFGAPGNNGRWWNNPRMITELKLTDDQRKAMDQILFQHREKLIDLQANLEKAELAMQPLMSADQPDRAAMEAQIDKVVAARADLEKANALFLLDIRMKLTADQWKQLKNMRVDRMEDRRGMDRRGGPRPQGQWRQRPGGPGGPPPASAPANPPANPPAQQPQGAGSGAEQ